MIGTAKSAVNTQRLDIVMLELKRIGFKVGEPLFDVMSVGKEGEKSEEEERRVGRELLVLE
jgi:hypothetical protein